MRNCPTITVRLAAALVLACVALPAAPAAAEADPVPIEVLRRLLADPTTIDAALAALAATEDKELLGVFAAAAKTSDRTRRVLAISAAAKLAGDGAAEILQDRLANDDSEFVRSEALAQLIEVKAIRDDQLIRLLSSNDRMLRCLAARALVRGGQTAVAAQTLRDLAGSSDVVAANLARMTLLSTGEMEQFGPLTQVMRDPLTPPRLVSMLLAQIEEDRIAPAAELARNIAVAAEGIPLKVRAYRAAAAAGPDGAGLLAQAIADSDQTVLRVQLLHSLADRSDAHEHVKALAPGDDAVGLLARLELARPAGGQTAADTALAAAELGHAVVIDYVLDRARTDIASRSAAAEFYVPAMVAIVYAAPTDAPAMLEAHTQAAQAAELLGDLATEQATQVVTSILADRVNARCRAVAAGMLRCKNRIVCDWVAPLLNSPYEELVTDAALTLGQHGDTRGTAALQDILRNPQRHPTELKTLAAWYLAKVTSRSAPALWAAAEGVRQSEGRP